MQSILTIVWANIKKKKLQSFLVGITLLLSSVLLTTAIGLIFTTSDPFEKMYKKLNGSHEIFYVNHNIYDYKDIHNWWNARSTVDATNSMAFLRFDGKITLNGKDISSGEAYFMEHPSKQSKNDKLQFISGKKKAAPGNGEIWLTSVIAYSSNVKVGNTVEFVTSKGNQKLKVSAIVTDPQYSAVPYGPGRYWVGGGALQKLFKEKSEHTVGIHFKDASAMETENANFKKYLKAPFMGYRQTKEDVGMDYQMIQIIISAIIMVFAVIIILLIAYVLIYIISAAVFSDYSVIGILKAQGLTPSNVILIYAAHYILIALVTIPLGIFAGNTITRIVLGILLKAMGSIDVSSSLILPAIISFAASFCVVTCAVFIAARKAGGVKAAVAIKYGSPEKKFKAGRISNSTIASKLPISALIGLNNTTSGKRQSIFILLTVGITAFVLVYAANISYSLNRVWENLSDWGFQKGDINIVVKDADYRQRIVSKMESDPRIINILGSKEESGVVLEKDNKESKNLIALIYSGNMDKAELTNLKGRNPLKKDEISVSAKVADEYGIKPGDIVALYYQGQKVAAKVRGIYQSVQAGGFCIRIPEAMAASINPQYVPTTYQILLTDKKLIPEVSKEYEAEYNSKIQLKAWKESVDMMFGSTCTTVAFAVLAIGSVFVIIGFIIIFNITLMNTYEGKKAFGIFKAMGMTPRQARGSLVWRAVFPSIPGLIFGMFGALKLSDKITVLMLSDVGIKQLPYDILLSGVIAAVLACIFLVVLGSWTSSCGLKKISSRNLIIE